MSIPRGHAGAVYALVVVLFAGCGSGTIQSGGTGAAGTTGAVGAGGKTGATGAAGAKGSAGTSGAAGASTAGSGAAGGTGAADPLNAARQACVDKINADRATLNVAPVARWTAAEACTDGQAKSDSESGTAHGAFSACMESAQDECPGWPSVDAIAGGTKSCLDQMWAEGPGTPYSAHGHFINMSNAAYTKVACGYYTTPAGKVWAAQDFK